MRSLSNSSAFGSASTWTFGAAREVTAVAALDNLSTEAALALIASLPRGQAEVIVLRVVAGLDVGQVARIVGKRPGAVRVAAHRGLRALAARLGQRVTR